MSDPIQHLNVTLERYIVYHFFHKQFPMYLDRHRAFTKRRAAQSIILQQKFPCRKRWDRNPIYTCSFSTKLYKGHRNIKTKYLRWVYGENAKQNLLIICIRDK